MQMGHTLSYLRFQLGKLVFPLLEPIFQCWENRDMDVRRHLRQGLVCLDKGKTAIALLNLNMVLSLNPHHFLALVSRGRLYLKEGPSQLATQDLLKANQVSAYRFIHYGLNSEYLQLLNKGVNNFGVSTGSNFSEILESLGGLNGRPEELRSVDISLPGERSTMKQSCEENKGDAPAFEKLTFGELDRKKIDKLGPITQQEIDDTDWDQLVKNFTS